MYISMSQKTNLKQGAWRKRLICSLGLKKKSPSLFFWAMNSYCVPKVGLDSRDLGNTHLFRNYKCVSGSFHPSLN